MADYQIAIDMSQETVETLAEGNFVLYGFKGVRTNMTGSPLVWFQSTNFATSTSVDWTVSYEAYTSNSVIIPGGVIKADNHYAIDLDQTLEVTGVKGTGHVLQEGVDEAISIHNQTSTRFTCGVSQKQFTGESTPMCAFPLYGNGLDVIAPVERVLLMFSSMPVNTGTVIQKAYSQGVLVDLTGARSRTVAFDIDQGWSWGGARWGQAVPANANLVPLLIEPTPTVLDGPAVPASRAAVTAGNGVPA